MKIFVHGKNKSFCQKADKTNEAISRKSKNPILGSFLPEKFAQEAFLKNRAPAYFGHYHFACLCKESEKTNEPIPRKAGNKLTEERTEIG